MNHSLTKVLVFILCTVMVLAVTVSAAAKDEGIDVVLVMDTSGSMKKTDPLSLRIPAAKLFMALLKKHDRAAVIGFSENAETLISLTPLDSSDNKEKLFSAADKISSTGKYTNLHDALLKGIEVLAQGSRKNRKQIIVLMSDGMMDVGNADEDRKLVEKMRSTLSARLEENNVKAYTVAFTEQSDRKLLEKISKRSGGFYNLAMTDKDFHVIFTSIFESLKSPEMLPMTKNGFLIDKSIEEVTIVASKGTMDTKIMLNSPDSKSYTSDDQNENVQWFISNNFDMITIKHPHEGRWEILFSTGENNKAYVLTDLKFITNFEKQYSTFGEPLDIEMWLEKEGVIIREPDILDLVTFGLELTSPDGRVTTLKPFNRGDGTYLRKIAPFDPGNYKLRVIATGKTFERSKDYVFNIADAQESKEDVQHEREKKRKLEEQAVEQQPVEENKHEENSWTLLTAGLIGLGLVLGIVAFFYFRSRRLKEVPSAEAVAPQQETPKTEEPEEETAQTVEQKAEAPITAAEEKSREQEIALDDEETTPDIDIEAANSKQEELSKLLAEDSEEEQEKQADASPEDVEDQDPAPAEKHAGQIVKEDVDIQDILSDAFQDKEEAPAKAEVADTAITENLENTMSQEIPENVPEENQTETEENPADQELKTVEAEAEEPPAVDNENQTGTAIQEKPEIKPQEDQTEPENIAVSQDLKTAGNEVKEDNTVQDILSDAFENSEETAAKAEVAETTVAEEENDRENQDPLDTLSDVSPQEHLLPEENAPENQPAKAMGEDNIDPVEKNDGSSLDSLWAEAFKEADEKTADQNDTAVNEDDISPEKPNAAGEDGADNKE